MAEADRAINIEGVMRLALIALSLLLCTGAIVACTTLSDFTATQAYVSPGINGEATLCALRHICGTLGIVFDEPTSTGQVHAYFSAPTTAVHTIHGDPATSVHAIQCAANLNIGFVDCDASGFIDALPR